MTGNTNGNINKWICLCLAQPSPGESSPYELSETCWHTAWYLINPTKDTKNKSAIRLAPFYKESNGTLYTTLVSLGSKIYQFGGTSVPRRDVIGLDDAKCLDTTKLFSTPIQRMDSHRVRPAAVVHSGKIYVFGTTSNTHNLDPSSWCRVYDPHNNTWEKLDAPPNLCSLHGWSLLKEGDQLLLFQPDSEVHSMYNFKDGSWTCVKNPKSKYISPSFGGECTYKPAVDDVIYYCNESGVFAIGLTTEEEESRSFLFRTKVEGLEDFWNENKYVMIMNPVLVHLGGNRFSLLSSLETKPHCIQCVTFQIETHGANPPKHGTFKAVKEHSAFYAVKEHYFSNALAFDTEIDVSNHWDGCFSGDYINIKEHLGGYNYKVYNTNDETDSDGSEYVIDDWTLANDFILLKSKTRLLHYWDAAMEKLMTALLGRSKKLGMKSLASASAGTIAVVAMVYYYYSMRRR